MTAIFIAATSPLSRLNIHLLLLLLPFCCVCVTMFENHLKDVSFENTLIVKITFLMLIFGTKIQMALII